MQVELTIKRKIKQASGRIRQGKIQIQVPHHWSQAAKKSAVDALVQQLKTQETQQDRWLNHPLAQQNRLTIDSIKALEALVHAINQQTIQVPLNKVRIGHAKYSQLAQMNVKTKTMTVSRHCLTDVPEQALRYLILHELAHCIEANHSRRFWAIVAQHMPDYRTQSKIMKAFHHRNVAKADTPATDNKAKESPEQMDFDGNVAEASLFSTAIERPQNSRQSQPQKATHKTDTNHPLLDWFQQLSLFQPLFGR